MATDNLLNQQTNAGEAAMTVRGLFVAQLFWEGTCCSVSFDLFELITIMRVTHVEGNTCMHAWIQIY